MVSKSITILLLLLLFHVPVNAKVAGSVIPEISKSLSPHITCAIFKDINGTVWFGANSSSSNNSTISINYAQVQQLNRFDSGRDNDDRILMALNFTIGLQSINSESIKLPKIKILVIQPLWKIILFAALILLILVINMIFIANYFAQERLKNKLKEYERWHALDLERQRLSDEMHDNILASLIHINNISGGIKKTDFETEAVEITHTTNKLITNISELNWCIQSGNKSLAAFFEHLRQKLHQLLQSGKAFSILLPDDESGHIALNITQQRNLLLMLNEMTDNAVRHSNATEIIVKAVIMDKGLQLFVNDNGKGFDAAQPTRGNGIKNIHQYIANLAGRLTLTTEPGLGTYYTVFIPLKSL